MSEEAKHTPGPWRLCSKGNYSNRVEGYSGRHAHSADDGFRTVAHFQSTDKDDTNGTANGLLIAAAPDLLDALCRITSVHTDTGDEQWDELIDIGRAAVAKATGEVSEDAPTAPCRSCCGEGFIDSLASLTDGPACCPNCRGSGLKNDCRFF